MKISPEVMAELDQLQVDAQRVVIARQLDRKLYVEVDKVLQALGGKWNRSAKAHVFSADALPLLDRAMTMGEVTTAKELGYFPTPAPLAKELVAMAGVKRGDRVLEPSAGEGAIVHALIAVGATVVAVERDADRRKKLRGIVPLIDVRDGVLDFMEFRSTVPFDAVVMNPAFAKIGKGDCIDHYMHAYEMLRPGGMLVGVGPSSLIFREHRRYKAFRTWVKMHAGTITELPEGSFKSSGTNVHTCVVRVVRA